MADSETPAVELRGVCRDFRRPRTSLREAPPVVRAVRDERRSRELAMVEDELELATR